MDLYDGESGFGQKFADYINAWYIPLIGIKWHYQGEWTDERLAQYLKEKPIQTMSERYHGSGDEVLNDAMKRHHEKVARLDKLARLANVRTDVQSFKLIWNEVHRII